VIQKIGLVIIIDAQSRHGPPGHAWFEPLRLEHLLLAGKIIELNAGFSTWLMTGGEKKQTEQKETLPQPKKQQSVANVNKKCLKSSTHWGFGIGASHLQWLHQWSPLSSISLSRRCRDSSSWLLRVSASFGWKGSLEIIENLDVVRVWNDQWIGLRENFNRKTPYLMGKSMVSCIFSLKPIHWHQGWFSKHLFSTLPNTAGQSQTLRAPLLFLAFAVWSLQAMFHLRLSRVCCADCAA